MLLSAFVIFVVQRHDHEVQGSLTRIEPIISDLKGHAFLDPVGGDKMTNKNTNEGSIGHIHLLTNHCNVEVYLAQRLRHDDVSRSLFIA